MFVLATALYAETQEEAYYRAMKLEEAGDITSALKAFEEANGIKVPYVIKPRRPGDIATCYSDPSKAERELGWKAQYGVVDMCRDSWRWQKNNPNGFEG